MSHNSFGHLFRVTTFGESHGPAIGGVIDGCPSGLELSEDLIQPALDARKPGGPLASQRQEADRCRILSGVYQGRTTGAPIAIVIENTDVRPKDYQTTETVYRPGHADYTYHQKYGHYDHRGGGRASARETAIRVGAGVVAQQILGTSVRIEAALVQLGTHALSPVPDDWSRVPLSPLFCPDATAEDAWRDHLTATRKAGSSLGGIVAVRARGIPAGWGAPVYGKLDADLAGALMSIPAAKGIEIGSGFATAQLDGQSASDEMTMGDDGQPQFLSNHAGGILGGISTGQELTARVAFKPTSSVAHARQTVTHDGQTTTIQVVGRHDPCVAIRAVPVVKAMVACVLADHKLRHRGQCGV